MAGEIEKRNGALREDMPAEAGTPMGDCDWSGGYKLRDYARLMYAPVSVLMRIVSPTSMKGGTRVFRPVSN